jgi:hypothetical protein
MLAWAVLNATSPARVTIVTRTHLSRRAGNKWAWHGQHGCISPGRPIAIVANLVPDEPSLRRNRKASSIVSIARRRHNSAAPSDSIHKGFAKLQLA